MLKTFRIGGIHPPENKLSAQAAIEVMAAPEQVRVLLSQHLGVPAKPVVSPKEKVKVGSLLAVADGFISANVHSPVSGTVLKIEEVVDQSGYKKRAVLIQTEGDDWEEGIDRSDTLLLDCRLTAKELITKIKQAGIVGLGGAAFPSHVKLVPPAGAKAEVLLINASECEPYLTADYALILEKPKEIVVGIWLLMRASGVNRAVIGIENNKQEAIALLRECCAAYPGIELCVLQTKYPQGGEKQLIDATLGKKVPGGSLPITVGVVVHNVATAFAVYEAVQKNKPLFERVVTVTGPSVQKPLNLRARLGTPLRSLIERAGGMPEDTVKVVAGGPMMGKALLHTEVPVAKGTSGVLLLPEGETKRRPMQDCIRCAECVFACPMHLEPFFLMTLTEFAAWDKADSRGVTDCIECGSCSFVCPSHRPLLDYIRMAKARVIKNKSKTK